MLLVIEVANSSLAHDRGEKTTVYAEAGIQDYWIANLRDGVIEVHRKPRGDTHGEKFTVEKTGEVSPLPLAGAKHFAGLLWGEA